MVKRRLIACVVLGLVTILCRGVLLADIEDKQPADVPPRFGRLDQLKPAPDSIKVKLDLDHTTFFLGESIAVNYEMTNEGKNPVPYEKGGFYPNHRLNDCFRMSAVRLDESGKPINEAVLYWPMPPNHGGFTGGIPLEPDQSYSTTLFVTRYVRFLEPGRYRLWIENVDRDQSVVYSKGETMITLKQPTPEEARKVYERMKRAAQGV